MYNLLEFKMVFIIIIIVTTIIICIYLLFVFHS